MSLREHLFRQAAEAQIEPTLALVDVNALAEPPVVRSAPSATETAPTGGMARRAYQQLKMEIHEAIIERVELEKLQHLSPEQVGRELAQLVGKLIEEGNILMNDVERRALVQDVKDEMLGLGPLEPLLKDPTISDILVNTAHHVYVERRGKLEVTDVQFYDNAHLMKVIEKIVSRVGRRIDESTPMVDARLADGSRINAIIPPSAIDGPLLSIRRFAANPLKVQDLVNYQSFTTPMVQLLEALIKAKINVLISGGTGSGKTTMLNLLSGFIPTDERIVTIEDAAELQLRQDHVLRLETRPPNIEGKGEISQRSLVKNALRMRPDRIILGEVRGAEALDMLHAMNTGHEGSMATIHANTPRDAVTRLENMVSMAGLALPPKAMRQQIASAITVIVQASRLTDGRRKLMSIQEITGMEGDTINMQEIFTFKRTGLDGEGRIKGYFCATGVRPQFSERLQAFGVNVPDHIYDPQKRYEV
jgi:pilus assembly protein CpaF